MKLNDSNLFRQQALINGEWLDANNGEAIDVTNPANGDKLGSVPKMGADETRAAIDAANRALSAVAEARPPGARSPPKNAPPFCATGSI